MGKLRQLCHWVTGQGRRIDECEFVPLTHPLRQWADVIPWTKFVAAVEASFASRFSKLHPCIFTCYIAAAPLKNHPKANNNCYYDNYPHCSHNRPFQFYQPPHSFGKL